MHHSFWEHLVSSLLHCKALVTLRNYYLAIYWHIYVRDSVHRFAVSLWVNMSQADSQVGNFISNCVPVASTLTLSHENAPSLIVFFLCELTNRGFLVLRLYVVWFLVFEVVRCCYISTLAQLCSYFWDIVPMVLSTLFCFFNWFHVVLCCISYILEYEICVIIFMLHHAGEYYIACKRLAQYRPDLYTGLIAYWCAPNKNLQYCVFL